jgi:flagellar basal-body rod protein FlgC
MAVEGSGIPIRGSMSPGEGFRRFFRSMGIASTGLSAQRARIEVIADNIANAETTRTADGTPYRRKVVQLEEIPFSALMEARGSSGNVPGPRGGGLAGDLEAGGVRILGTAEEMTEGPLVYDPGHPDANEDGYVQMPNVSITDEMVDLMEARRLYEANASVFEAVKSMLRRATQL